MTNKTRGETELVFQGRVLVIRPTMSLLAVFEERYGPLWQVAEKVAAGQLPVTLLIDMIAFLTSFCGQPPAAAAIFEDILENGIGIYVSALAGFLSAVLSSRMESLPSVPLGESTAGERPLGEAGARSVPA